MASLVYQAFREFFPHHTQEKVESKKNSELNFVGYTLHGALVIVMRI